ITKADESREAENALHEGNRRLGKVDAMKLARVVKLGTEMDLDLWNKVVKILKMTDAEKNG
ncbi:predicted protein, partial [Arabidopsis lyrata subsp. lyrata]